MPRLESFAAFASLGLLLLVVARSPGQETSSAASPPAVQDAAAEQPSFPDLSISPDADLPTLEAVLAKAKAAEPRSPEQYQAMQTAIRDGSQRILHLLKDQAGTPRFQQAELDKLTASLALMAFIGENAQAKTQRQVHEYLKSRKEISLQDVRTGMMAGAMLELQPDKQPARETYQLLYDLLEDDEREEMQNLRLNLQATVRRLDLLGSHFDLQAKSLEGKALAIEDYEGKYVVVDFFATWCEPCLAEIPRLQKHYEKYHAKGLEVIGISLDGDADSLQQFLKRTELPWPIVHDNAENPVDRLQMQFGVSHLPTVLLLNKEGTVVSLEARGAELDRLLTMLFEAPTPAATPEVASPNAAAAEAAAAEAADTGDTAAPENRAAAAADES
ncbi:MAG: TlpA family protein disulfide reductase [Planctomycetales bacterium]|nr:TlpA family protein disulfide reductase [Planctomycetales bacterium]